jgi:hypothetical protein
VPVKEIFEAKTVWEGVVHVFKINGHPKANKAYAWSSPIEGSEKRRFFAVLHVPPVTSPVEAVPYGPEHRFAAMQRYVSNLGAKRTSLICCGTSK